MRFYLLCRDCEGVGRIDGEVCGACEGYGGYWVLVGAGGGIRIRVIPGDRDDRPDEPP